MFETIIFDVTLDRLKLKTFVKLIPTGSKKASPYYAIVDTGSSDTAMSEHLFNNLGYKEQEKIPTTITGVNGKSKGFSIIIDDFILGGVNLGKTRITVSKFEPEFENVVILGMNVLAWFNTLISYNKKEVTLGARKIKSINKSTRFSRADIFTKNILASEIIIEEDYN
jgi:hypothetical protein